MLLGYLHQLSNNAHLLTQLEKKHKKDPRRLQSDVPDKGALKKEDSVWNDLNESITARL